MSLEERGRAAVLELRSGTTLPPATDVVRRSTRRQRGRLGIAALAGVAVLVAAGLAGGRITAMPPSPTPGTAVPAPRATLGLACHMWGISCAAGRIRVYGDMAVPVSFTSLPGLDTDNITPSSEGFEVRRTDALGRASGITVLDNPTANPAAGRPGTAPHAGSSAASFATWLTSLPFTAPTSAMPVTVGGYDGFRVDVSVRPGAVLPTDATGAHVLRVFVTGRATLFDWSTQLSDAISVTRYYVADVPGGSGVVVAWVWTSRGDPADLDQLDEVVASMRFG
jgi:hypothetical protein